MKYKKVYESFKAREITRQEFFDEMIELLNDGDSYQEGYSIVGLMIKNVIKNNEYLKIFEEIYVDLTSSYNFLYNRTEKGEAFINYILYCIMVKWGAEKTKKIYDRVVQCMLDLKNRQDKSTHKYRLRYW